MDQVQKSQNTASYQDLHSVFNRGSMQKTKKIKTFIRNFKTCTGCMQILTTDKSTSQIGFIHDSSFGI